MNSTLGRILPIPEILEPNIMWFFKYFKNKGSNAIAVATFVDGPILNKVIWSIIYNKYN